MSLKVNLSHLFDEEANELELTEQEKSIFKFLTTIVASVSENINQSLIDVDLKCSTRADQLR